MPTQERVQERLGCDICGGCGEFFYDCECDYREPPSVRNAREVLGLWSRIQELEYEVRRLREMEKEYHKLLDVSLRQAQESTGLMLQVALNGIQIGRQEKP